MMVMHQKNIFPLSFLALACCSICACLSVRFRFGDVNLRCVLEGIDTEQNINLDTSVLVVWVFRAFMRCHSVSVHLESNTRGVVVLV